MSFLEHECNISLAAALAFLDESMDASESSNSSTTASTPSATTQPSTAADPAQLLEALDDDLGAFTASSPLPQPADAMQLESAALPVQETTIVPASTSFYRYHSIILTTVNSVQPHCEHQVILYRVFLFPETECPTCCDEYIQLHAGYSFASVKHRGSKSTSQLK
ncbi:hypothetical protein F444_13985 [Phytophthora nicotianae P1976]|uniref:Uncharacterized protein n=1 Tax=Phytophthora nicotianae P1976 TaxID=1317066 RepID=A0A080ZS09_PHYNI|nr:hypothetical protein F444_13985 [Phytophthora nicotianae P1976]